MSFAMFPPEINSALISTGPGSGSLLAAAGAWNSLAEDLTSAATGYQTVISNLVGGSWTGPSSTAMATAAAPYVTWLHTTAANAGQAGAQAAAAAGAYEAARASSVPVPVVAANRTTLAMLVATNLLGQNTPAIAANEAAYLEMWAQDALAMDTYATTSQHTTVLPTQTPAPPVATNTVANAAAAAQPAATAAASHAASAAASPASGLSSLFSGSPLSGVLGGLGGTGATTAAGGSSAAGLQAIYYPVLFATLPLRVLLGLLVQLARGGAGAATGIGLVGDQQQQLLDSVGKLVDGKMQLVSTGVTNQLKTWGSSVSAQLASAHRLGGLAVPQAWASGATAMSRAAPVLPATTVSAPTMASPGGMPGGPFGQALAGSLSGRGVSALAGKAPAPKVVPRSPAGG